MLYLSSFFIGKFGINGPMRIQHELKIFNAINVFADLIIRENLT